MDPESIPPNRHTIFNKLSPGILRLAWSLEFWVDFPSVFQNHDGREQGSNPAENSQCHQSEDEDWHRVPPALQLISKDPAQNTVTTPTWSCDM